MTAAPQVLHKGVVKQVLSGDAVIIRGQPRGGPPPERTLCFSNITAPRLARRANPNQPGSIEGKDEPWAWEAREYVRQKLVGKEVYFTVEYKAPANNREYGCVYLTKDPNSDTRVNITELIVAEGLVELRRSGLRADDENAQKLIQLEEAARTTGKGKWGENPDSHIRDITWIIENPRQFVDSYHQKPIEAVIEHVRDGCTVRAFLLPSMHYVTVMLSGIKCPMFKTDEAGNQTSELFADEAKFFTECRLLQREVKIIMESVSNQNILGTVLHPNGNIAELLLKEGFARCVDWSMGVVSQGPEKLRAAEKLAKEKQLRIWKDYSPLTAPTMDIKDKHFQGKVVEVVNGDAVVVKMGEGQFKKCFLASIKPPRPVETDPTQPKERNMRSRPLYDIPYMFEAREFLRKKLVGKKINVEVDYIQPPNQGFPEKTCCTITIGDINVAEALVSRGLATVIRYRQDDDQRSSRYDLLLVSEERAKKKGVGIHSKKESPLHKVADISGDVPKSKQFLPFLTKAPRLEALCEFVASGSRLRLYLAKETCLITFLVSGIEAPRGSRPGPAGSTIPAEPFGEEATMFTKELCLQREVEVKVETTDKGGNFIGWLFVDGVNLSQALVENGLAKVHFSAERSEYFSRLQEAESAAKEKRLKIWAKYEEPKVDQVVEESSERSVSYRTVVVTEVENDLKFFAQTVENGPRLEKLMEELRLEMDANPPVTGAYTPKRGELCAAKFSQDNQWYRAKIEKIEGSKISVRFIDFGNREVTDVTKLAQIGSAFTTLSGQAIEYALALIALPEDEEQKNDALDGFYNDVINRQFMLNVEMRNGGMECVSLMDPESKEDVAKGLLSSGLVLVEQRKEKRFNKLVSEYTKAQDVAKSKRLNIWRYGDFRQDDAREFGFARS